MIQNRENSILIVDDTPANVALLLDQLSQHGFKILVAEDGESAIEQVKYARPDLILLDVLMPGIDGFETCRRLKAEQDIKDIPVIFMTALSETTDKVKGFKTGAVDYVTKPFQYEEVLARVTTHLTIRKLQKELQEANEKLEQRVAERTGELKAALEEVEKLKNRLAAENIYLREEIKLERNFEEIIGRSEALKNVLHKAEQVAGTDATVLLLGETGTGKELMARAVHNLSRRKDRPLVKVNCAALPANLIESELFGHEKGAFTGALVRKIGRFEIADGGTIFLDEIGDLPLELQAKLLRVLQEGEFERLGSAQTIKVNVRVIAATNRDISKAIENGEFREDLYYRLNVFPIQLPSLWERKADIPLLVKYFVKKFSARLGKVVEQVPQPVMAALQNYSWPGNIRELENVIERAIILSNDSNLQIEELQDRKQSPQVFPEPVSALENGTLEAVERSHILETLKETNWMVEGKRGAASRLGLHPSTLRDRMKKLGIKRPG